MPRLSAPRSPRLPSLARGAGVWGAAGRTHAEALLRSGRLFPFFPALSASGSAIRAGPHRSDLGSLALQGGTSLPPPTPAPPSQTPAAQGQAAACLFRSRPEGGRGEEAGRRGLPAPRGRSCEPSGSPRAERVRAGALKRAAPHVRALSPAPCFLSLGPARCHPSEFD